MTPHNSPRTHYQTRLNLINAVSDFLTEGYRDADVDEGQDRGQLLLTIYRNDTHRRMEGKPGSLEYLSNELKVGVRLAGDLMYELQQNQGDYLLNWYHGKSPENLVEAFHNLLFVTVLELTKSILEVEGQHPGLKHIFDSERAAYWRSQNRADEADQSL